HLLHHLRPLLRLRVQRGEEIRGRGPALGAGELLAHHHAEHEHRTQHDQGADQEAHDLPVVQGQIVLLLHPVAVSHRPIPRGAGEESRAPSVAASPSRTGPLKKEGLLPTAGTRSRVERPRPAGCNGDVVATGWDATSGVGTGQIPGRVAPKIELKIGCSLSQVASRCSFTTLVSASSGMKLLSPMKRGTTW